MIFNRFLYLLNYFRKVSYLIVFIGYSSVYAGSYEDFFKAIKVTAESRSARDESPLMLAALHGLLAECQTLIQLGADVNKPGWTPLHYAATKATWP